MLKLMYKTGFILIFLCVLVSNGNAQTERFLQHVRYIINIDLDDTKNQFNGFMSLQYVNNSSDTLNELFFHLYYNAFQPGSDMDIRSRTIIDPDRRIGNRIAELKENEIGFQKIKSIKQIDKKLKFDIDGTIMKVLLDKKLLPRDSTRLTIQFNAQIPIQIRRTGRNSAEGIDYSMAQWYPKICEYDEEGWHTDPYIAREFYAPWGDFDVQIRLDKKYCVAASGIQKNAQEVNCNNRFNADSKKLNWHFVAQNVHDFVWSADPDYTETIFPISNNRSLHFFFQENEKNKEAWQKLPEAMITALDFMENKFGPYAYPKYSFIQAGDGGMEYPMATFVTGNRPFRSLVGVCVHEWMHSWYQMMLATNESLYPWMDEGFTEHAELLVINYLREKGILTDKPASKNPFKELISNYIDFLHSGNEEALTTHADHYLTNTAYGQASYNKGALTLVQLRYIIGNENVEKGLLQYYWQWRFKHPNPNDFFRVMEKTSHIELDWFKNYWVNSTKTMDYKIDTLMSENKSNSIVVLKRNGLFPMPIDLEIEFTNGKKQLYNIPLDLMRGSKPMSKDEKVRILDSWHWVNPYYYVKIDENLEDIKSVKIDPNELLLDVNAKDNFWQNVPHPNLEK